MSLQFSRPKSGVVDVLKSEGNSPLRRQESANGFYVSQTPGARDRAGVVSWARPEGAFPHLSARY